MGRRLKREYLFGISPCLAAILAKRREIYSLIICHSLQEARNLRPELQQIITCAQEQNNCTIKYHNPSLMDKLSGNRPHQKVMIDCQALQYSSMEALLKMTSSKAKKQKNRPYFFLALDQVQDPMNFGAVLRSALYFGVDAVISTKENGCRLSPVVSKASSGAMEWLPVYDAGNLSNYLTKQRDSGWDILGTVSHSRAENESRQEKVLDVIDLPLLRKNTMLVVGYCSSRNSAKEEILKKGKTLCQIGGNEGLGMTREVEECCTKLITIMPKSKIKPGMESLNLSVATGTLLHTLMNQNKENVISTSGAT